MTETVIVGSGIVAAGFPDDDPIAVLGKRGLRYKDEATRLGMAAVELALHNAGITDCSDVVTAVVASSNYGNLDTVCKVAGNGLEPGERGPMDLPNASSNVVASSIAIRFGLFGPNLMMCSGANSGLDALGWAEILLATKRAARVAVVGVEVRNTAVERFATAHAEAGLFHGAACVLLESSGAATTVMQAEFHGCARDAAIPALLRRTTVDRWYTPDSGLAPDLPEALDADRIDLAARVGAASGALGVLQAALAVSAGGSSLLTTGGGSDPLTACLITPISVTTSGEQS